MIRKIFIIIFFLYLFQGLSFSSIQLPSYSSSGRYSYSSGFINKMKTVVAFLKTYMVFLDSIPDAKVPIKVKYGSYYDMFLFSISHSTGCYDYVYITAYNLNSGYNGYSSGLFQCGSILYYVPYIYNITYQIKINF
jgi:hypothetical protein